MTKGGLELQKSKNELIRARSRLYRSQILQVNTRWKALAEIYTMHSFAPFSNLKIFVKNCCFFSAFFPKIRKFCQNFAEFSPNVTKFFRDFSKMQHFSKIFKMCNIFLGIFSKNCRCGIFRTRNCKKSDSVNHIPSVLYCFVKALPGAQAAH